MSNELDYEISTENKGANNEPEKSYEEYDDWTYDVVHAAFVWEAAEIDRTAARAAQAIFYEVTSAECARPDWLSREAARDLRCYSSSESFMALRPLVKVFHLDHKSILELSHFGHEIINTLKAILG